ncbi:MAG: mechanosensitive ion channel [Gammaproteobacteria bacterium]|nr:MAG: mechanosensitive ion channel [Gammaproteobacteria bacterium]
MENLVQTLLASTMFWVPKVSGAVAIVLIFLVASRIAKAAISRASAKLKLDDHVVVLVARISGVALVMFGFILALGVLGVNVSALIAGLGLTGFALGFALKDTISNLLSGVLILLYQPFEIGDRIKISGYEGDVVAIDLRYTELSSEGDKILIPNSKLFTDPITVCYVVSGESVDSKA